jgi:hypothetical protein
VFGPGRSQDAGVENRMTRVRYSVRRPDPSTPITSHRGLYAPAWRHTFDRSCSGGRYGAGCVSCDPSDPPAGH